MIDSEHLSGLAHYSADAAPLWVNVIGGAAGLLGLVSHWPQVWRLWVRRQYTGLSALSCVLNALTTFTWFSYGVGLGSPVQSISNGLALSGALGILAGLVWLARPGLVAWLPALALGFATVAAVAALTGARGVGWLASAVTLSMAVPQVVLLVRRRRAGLYDAGGVSRPRWALTAACNAGWAGYAAFTLDGAIGLTSTTMVALSLAVIVLCRSDADGSASQASAAQPPRLDESGGARPDAQTSALPRSGG